MKIRTEDTKVNENGIKVYHGYNTTIKDKIKYVKMIEV